MVRITPTSVLVDDQDKALKFYTEVLGFVKKQDLPAGAFRFLTVVSPEGPDDVELLLEPNDNPAARTFQQAIYAQGMPASSKAPGQRRARTDQMAADATTIPSDGVLERAADGRQVLRFERRLAHP